MKSGDKRRQDQQGASEMSLGEVTAGLALLAAAAWFWRGRGVRELALQHAIQRCRAEGLQLLDAHVAFAGWRWWHDGTGSRRLLRRYSFEFSVSGQERFSGSLGMYGRRLVQMELPPYPVPEGQESATVTLDAVRQIPAAD